MSKVVCVFTECATKLNRSENGICCAPARSNNRAHHFAKPPLCQSTDDGGVWANLLRQIWITTTAYPAHYACTQLRIIIKKTGGRRFYKNRWISDAPPDRKRDRDRERVSRILSHDPNFITKVFSNRLDLQPIFLTRLFLYCLLSHIISLWVHYFVNPYRISREITFYFYTSPHKLITFLTLNLISGSTFYYTFLWFIILLS